MLSDGFLANSAEPWSIPDPAAMAPIPIAHPTAAGLGVDDDHPFLPYARDAATLARPWALPGTEGLEHRIGGLSKQPGTGNVSYAPEDQERMVTDRAAKVAALANVIPEQAVFGDPKGRLLVLSWGGTYGTMRQAVITARQMNMAVSHAHLRYLNPFPRNLADVLGRFDEVLLPEMNGGQLALLIQGRFLRPVISMPKVQAQPFRVSEVLDRIRAELA